MHLVSLIALTVLSTAASGQLRAPAEIFERETPYEEAQAAEIAGRVPAAVKLYIRAARYGDPRAAERLAEMYDKGAPGVERDYAESLKWRNAARVLAQQQTKKRDGRIVDCGTKPVHSPECK